MAKRNFRSKYTALISLLNIQPDSKDYRREISIIKKIVDLGYTEREIYGAWNYYANQKRNYNSFKILLWNRALLIEEIMPLLKLNKKEVHVEIDDKKDFRTNKDFKPTKKNKIDFLS